MEKYGHRRRISEQTGGSFSPDLSMQRPLARVRNASDLEEGVAEPARKRVSSSSHRWFPSVRVMLVSAAALYVVTLVTFIFLGYRDARRGGLQIQSPIGHHRRIRLDQVLAGDFEPETRLISWLDVSTNADVKDDGYYVTYRDGSVILARVESEEERVLAAAEDHKLDLGATDFRYMVAPSLKHVLFATNVRRVWRHSFEAEYHVFDVEAKTLQPLRATEPSSLIRFASFSPHGTWIAFVMDNNIYLNHVATGAESQLTVDGSRDMFNGIPDWVYEEEIFSSNRGLWFSPDEEHLAYIKINETDVPTFRIPFFLDGNSNSHNKDSEGNSDDDNVRAYPRYLDLKYPKPGYANPVADVYVANLATMESSMMECGDSGFPDDNRLVHEVIWLGSSQLLAKHVTRDSLNKLVYVMHPETKDTELVRRESVDEHSEKWYEVGTATVYVPAGHGRSADGYIEVKSSNGYDHLAFFSPANSSAPTMLTMGEWEVDGGPLHYDPETDFVYFASTEKSPLERHIYRVSISNVGDGASALTDVATDGYYSASFSRRGHYYLLNYKGPAIPRQTLYSTRNSAFSKSIEANEALVNATANYDLPQKRFSTINVEGYDLNVMEELPPNFDDSGWTQYPVLFHVYGGPGSQLVTKKFSVDFQSFMASSPQHEYIVVTVDGRGTGFMGWRLRRAVHGHLGELESHDQVMAAAAYKKMHDYADANRFAIWGWSFGGYTTLKTLEQASGVFQYGVAVAPVTDWRFYDSVYTERYMRTPDENPHGYDAARVANATAVATCERFMIMHGTGDDNVHLQNTLTLLDKFDVEGIENYDVHFFPDSNHGIYFHNAQHAVYHRLFDWLSTHVGKKAALEALWD